MIPGTDHWYLTQLPDTCQWWVVLTTGTWYCYLIPVSDTWYWPLVPDTATWYLPVMGGTDHWYLILLPDTCQWYLALTTGTWYCHLILVGNTLYWPPDLSTSRANVPFMATHHLHNQWNENRKVQVSRDGQVSFGYSQLVVLFSVLVKKKKLCASASHQETPWWEITLFFVFSFRVVVCRGFHCASVV